MTTPPPTRSRDQRATALERANLIRRARANLKRAIKAGRGRELVELAVRLDVDELDRRGAFGDEDVDAHVLDSLYLRDLLLVVPGFGSVKVNRMLREHVISQSKTLGGLSDRQRGELLADLRILTAGIRRGTTTTTEDLAA